MIRLVVLDFDGTLTDADAHAPAFTAAHRAELAAGSALPRAAVEVAWTTALAELAGASAEEAYLVAGHLSVAAHADPYVTSNCAADRVLGALTPLDAEARLARNGAAFAAAYRRAPPAFRPEAGAVLEHLLGHCPVAIVSNSPADAIAARVASLGLTGIRCRGGARKLFIEGAQRSPRLSVVPWSMQLPGLARPALLHRGGYLDALEELWSSLGCEPEETLVAGDIYEIDLALPAALGAAVHLVLRPSTLEHERVAAEAERRGSSGTLESVLERVHRAH